MRINMRAVIVALDDSDTVALGLKVNLKLAFFWKITQIKNRSYLGMPASLARVACAPVANVNAQKYINRLSVL